MKTLIHLTSKNETNLRVENSPPPPKQPILNLSTQFRIKADNVLQLVADASTNRACRTYLKRMSPEDIEDLRQDVVVKLLSRVDEVHPMAYVIKAIVNTRRDQLKRKRTDREVQYPDLVSNDFVEQVSDSKHSDFLSVDTLCSMEDVEFTEEELKFIKHRINEETQRNYTTTTLRSITKSTEKQLTEGLYNKIWNGRTV